MFLFIQIAIVLQMMLLLALIVACCIGMLKIKNPASALNLPFLMYIALGSAIYLQAPVLTELLIYLFIALICLPISIKIFHWMLTGPKTGQPTIPPSGNKGRFPIVLGIAYLIWLGLLIPLWQLPHVWDIKSGELSSSTPAVHDITGVSADTPLLQVEVTKEQPNIEFPMTYHEAYMAESPQIGTYRINDISRSFTHDMAGLQLPVTPLMLTPDMVHPQQGWNQPTVKDNILTITSPDNTRYRFAYFTLPQHTTVYYSGSIQDGILRIFRFNTDPHGSHYAISATKDSLENEYKIYTDRYLSDFLFRLSLMLCTLLGAASLCYRPLASPAP